MEDETNIVKVAVLEQKVFDLKEIVLKLEEAIERINDVNSNITKMLAVHDERININEQNNHTLYEKVWELSTKIDTNKVEVEEKIQKNVDKISEINNKILIIFGAMTLIGFIIANRAFFGALLQHTLTPSPQPPALTNPR